MRWRIDWSAEASEPSRAAVLTAAGLPPDPALPARIAAILEEAFGIYRRLAEPRAVVRLVDRDEFVSVYGGEGRNDDDTPVARIAPSAEALALFAATVGGPLTSAIADLFERQEPAVGFVLDAVASEAADALSYAVAGDCLVRLGGAGRLGRDSRTLPYSPGYCGWHVTGQRALFAALRPEDIGITLNDSCLMQPLKSVSGVILSAPAGAHRLDPDFPCCGACGTPRCQDRT